MATTTTSQTTNNNKSLPLVPESLLKKRHDLEDLNRKRAASAHLSNKWRGRYNNTSKNKKGNPTNKKRFYVKKMETFMAQARSEHGLRIRYKRIATKGMQKRASNYPVIHNKETEDDVTGETVAVKYQANSVGAKLVFVVRIRNNVGLPRCMRQLLHRMHLRNVHDGILLPYTEQTRKRLHQIEPCVIYGPPTRAVLKDLLERRGHGRVHGERVPLSDNTVIEEQLGDTHNILCVEDMIHELHTVGEHFHAVARFLWPFRLADSKTEFERKTLGWKEGKDYGDRGETINEYIQQVL